MVPGIILFALLRLPDVCEWEISRLPLHNPIREGFADYPLHENSPSNQNRPSDWLGATWLVNLIQGRKGTTSEKFSTVRRMVRGP
jgi:hypothetical protein